MSHTLTRAALGALGVLAATSVAQAQFTTKYTKSQMKALNGWSTTPIFTVGEFLPSLDMRFAKGYQPIGILDGLGIRMLSSKGKGKGKNNGYGKDKVQVLCNHELTEAAGRSYKLANGTELKGARISFFDFDSKTRQLLGGGIAYDSIFDRRFKIVTKAVQINDSNEKDDPRTNLDAKAGLSRLCSSQMVHAGTYGFKDDVYLTGEETGDPGYHPNGGSCYALDAKNRRLWAVPALGRGAFENLTAVSAPHGYVALLIGDDSSPQDRNNPSSSAGSSTKPEDTVCAPLYLYIGKKNASKKEIMAAYPKGTQIPKDDFLNRNGLLVGKLYYMVLQNRKMTDPRQFNGSGNVTGATWRPIDVLSAANAGKAGYDLQGYKDGFTMRLESKLGGSFQFSRPEDLSTSPRFGGRSAVLASTGRGRVFGGADKWGVLYQIFLMNLRKPTMPWSTIVRIQYDGNEKDKQDFGVRSPDNLVWGNDGIVYVQEDDAISSSDTFYQPGKFGDTSKEEASIWAVHPWHVKATRIGQIDRSVVVPTGTTDGGAGDIGNWESSGIIDVSRFFKTKGGEKLLLFTVQAHGIRDGIIAQNGLEQGGQLVFLSLGKKKSGK